MQKALSMLLLVACTLSLPRVIQAQTSVPTFFGPTAYTSEDDSPFFNLFIAEALFLEDFEDGIFDLLGTQASTGTVIAPGSLTDSVDNDDGTIDGLGQSGRSFFTGSGSNGITFTFDSGEIGTLPRHAGLVWTDGEGSTRFEAFDAIGTSLGVINANIADGSNSGTTADDNFFGVSYAGGIGSIKISNTAGGIEVDHVQFSTVPEPSTWVLLGLGLLTITFSYHRNRLRC